MKNIILTGFMASGKTEVGQKLAKLCKYPFVDTDNIIVKAEGKSINEIFAESGENYFRNIEGNIVKKVAQLSNTIIATGGGVVLRPENMEQLRRSGVIFCLAPDFEVIEHRIKKAAETRPLLNGQTIEQIKMRYEERKPMYNNCDYKITITENQTPTDSANQIIKIYNSCLL